MVTFGSPSQLVWVSPLTSFTWQSRRSATLCQPVTSPCNIRAKDAILAPQMLCFEIAWLGKQARLNFFRTSGWWKPEYWHCWSATQRRAIWECSVFGTSWLQKQARLSFFRSSADTTQNTRNVGARPGRKRSLTNNQIALRGAP